MHELAIMESMVDTIVERIGDHHVVRVRLEIGELAGVDVDALRFSFDVCAGGTQLAGAELAIASIPGRARCHACGVESAMATLISPCVCGSFDRELVTGGELRLKDLEVI